LIRKEAKLTWLLNRTARYYGCRNNNPERKIMNQVKVKRVSTNEELISKRTIGYQIFINDEFLLTCDDVCDAMDFKEKLEKQPHDWVKIESHSDWSKRS